MSFSFSQDLLSEAGVITQSESQFLTQPLTQPSPGVRNSSQVRHLQSQEFTEFQTQPLLSQEWPDPSQGCSLQDSQHSVAAPRVKRTLARPPTWPSLPRECANMPDQRKETKWKFSRGSQQLDGASGVITGRDQLRYQLSSINSQVHKLPLHVSKLLEDAVHSLVTNLDTGKEVFQDKIVDLTSTLGEINKSKHSEENEVKERLNHLEEIIKTMREEVDEQASSRREVLTILRNVSTALIEVKYDLKKHSESLEKLSEEMKGNCGGKLAETNSVARKQDVQRVRLDCPTWQTGHLNIKVEDQQEARSESQITHNFEEEISTFRVIELYSDTDSDFDSD